MMGGVSRCLAHYSSFGPENSFARLARRAILLHHKIPERASHIDKYTSDLLNTMVRSHVLVESTIHTWAILFPQYVPEAVAPSKRASLRAHAQ